MCCRQQGYCTARTTSLHSLMHDPMSCAQQRGAQAVSGWRTCSRVIRAYAWAVGGGLPARWRTEHAGVGEEGLGGARVGCRRQRPRPLQGASPSGGSGAAHGARGTCASFPDAKPSASSSPAVTCFGTRGGGSSTQARRCARQGRSVRHVPVLPVPSGKRRRARPCCFILHSTREPFEAGQPARACHCHRLCCCCGLV